ncbi:prolactin-7B1 [Mastomys coucha]|uniref:prolactin-7B1 n=1 Tax=Mastomys coucha TaxID=35658 RepID=UPI0012619DA5|nr:prolactin-7B1 [Mastomys coucha]XP_031214664.1 prolactin-7B1 [Mastomys coucha]XP_031214665.1 prolactin-7B1 [Mastomys coucha]
MNLSLTQPCFWALQILLVSNLLQWEIVVSLPTNGGESGVNEKLTEDLFDDAIILSQHINGLAIETRRIFLSNNFSSDMFIAFTLQFNRHDEFVVNGLNSCHTLSLKTPKTEKEAQRISLPDFVKMILSILRAWDNPLYHLEIELKNMPGAPFAILARVKDIEVKNKILLDRIMKIAKKVKRGIEENEEYPVWSELASLQSANEESRFFALYKLSYCLFVDTDKVEHFLKHLKCRYFDGYMCQDSANQIRLQ